MMPIALFYKHQLTVKAFGCFSQHYVHIYVVAAENDEERQFYLLIYDQLKYFAVETLMCENSSSVTPKL